VRRALLAVLAAIAAAGAAPAAEPVPAAQQEALLDEAWAARLSGAATRRDAALSRLRSDELALRVARHRKYPRGEALGAVERNVEASREQLGAAEQALPELLEEARRAGVSSAVLHPYEGE
jgi:cobalamin biosynthesis protein CobT